MRKQEIIKEKRIKNEYGVEFVYTLKEEYNETSNGVKFNINYVVVCGGYIDGHYTNGYYRSYKRLANALNDSYVQKYLMECE